MSANSAIEWTRHTFNPWWGCVKVSPGCQHCYAESQAKRFGHKVWGPGSTTKRRMMSDSYWQKPLAWDRAGQAAGERHRVFSASMADVFEENAQLWHERDRLFKLIRRTPHLDWLLLTKRPDNIARLLPRDWGDGYPNVWLGTSIETHEYSWRIRALAEIPARVRFLSCEPLLGPLRLDLFLRGSGISWVIAGGESGPHARPLELDWLRAVRDDCAWESVAFFLKQLGGHPDKRGGDDALLDGQLHREMPVVTT